MNSQGKSEILDVRWQQRQRGLLGGILLILLIWLLGCIMFRPESSNGPLQLLWQRQIPCEMLSCLGVDADALYLLNYGKSDLSLQSLGHDGRQRWKKQLPYISWHTLQISGEQLCLISAAGDVMCLSREDGAKLWQYTARPWEEPTLSGAETGLTAELLVAGITMAHGLDLTGNLLWTRVIEVSSSRWYQSMKGDETEFARQLLLPIDDGGLLVIDAEGAESILSLNLAKGYVSNAYRCSLGNERYLFDNGVDLVVMHRDGTQRKLESGMKSIQVPDNFQKVASSATGQKCILGGSKALILTADLQDGWTYDSDARMIFDASWVGEDLCIVQQGDDPLVRCFSYLAKFYQPQASSKLMQSAARSGDDYRLELSLLRRDGGHYSTQVGWGNRLGIMASCISDGNRVYVVGSDGKLSCVELQQ